MPIGTAASFIQAFYSSANTIGTEHTLHVKEWCNNVECQYNRYRAEYTNRPMAAEPGKEQELVPLNHPIVVPLNTIQLVQAAAQLERKSTS